MKGDQTNPMNGCCQGFVISDMWGIEGFDPQRGIGLIVSSNDGASFVGADTVWGNAYPSGFGLVPGQWHHVAGTYDGSLLWLYVDGKLKPAIVHEGNISPMATGSFLTFGSEDGRRYNPVATAGRYFRGLIDEVSYYSRALSPSEVAAIYTAGDTGKCNVSQSVTVTPGVINRGGSVTVNWNGIANPSPRDWLGLYQLGAPNSPFWAWEYVSCTQSPTVAEPSGTCAFQIPVNPPPGNYNIRLFSNNGFSVIATSSTFVLQ